MLRFITDTFLLFIFFLFFQVADESSWSIETRLLNISSSFSHPTSVRQTIFVYHEKAWQSNTLNKTVTCVNVTFYSHLFWQMMAMKKLKCKQINWLNENKLSGYFKSLFWRSINDWLKSRENRRKTIFLFKLNFVQHHHKTI